MSNIKDVQFMGQFLVKADTPEYDRINAAYKSGRTLNDFETFSLISIFQDIKITYVAYVNKGMDTWYQVDFKVVR